MTTLIDQEAVENLNTRNVCLSVSEEKKNIMSNIITNRESL